MARLNTFSYEVAEDCAVKEESVKDLNDILQRLQNIEKNLGDASSELYYFVERIYGPYPAGESCGKDALKPNGVVAEIFDAINRVETRVSQLYENIHTVKRLA